MSIFDHYQSRYEAAKDEELSIQEFLSLCKDDKSVYANAAERLLLAIGEPEIIDTAQDPRLSRIFSNRVISRYKEFEDFYGMEDAIEQIVSYLKHAAQGLEERKQILYLLGPVGGGKSSLAEKLKALMQKMPIYILLQMANEAQSMTIPSVSLMPVKMASYSKKNTVSRNDTYALSCRHGRPNVCMNLAVTSPSLKSSKYAHQS